MKNTKRLKLGILVDIRRNVPMGDKEQFTDDEINAKTNKQLLDHWLKWNGMVGWTESIIDAVENIYGVKLGGK